MMVRRSAGSTQLQFPVPCESYRSILVWVPEQPGDALRQIVNITGIVSLFPNATVYLVCNRDVAGYFRPLGSVATLVEYSEQATVLFSKEFEVFRREIRELAPDAVFNLHAEYSLAVATLIVLSGAPLRVGYEGIAGYPFVNIQVRPDTSPRLIDHRNASIARAFGAHPSAPPRWSVSKETVEEVRHVLKEQTITTNNIHICIDAVCFYVHYGQRWTEKLLAHLPHNDTVKYSACTTTGTPDEVIPWLQHSSLSIFHATTPSRLAAFIHCTSLIVSGNSLLYQLSALLQHRATALFSEEHSRLYFHTGIADHTAVLYSDAPDQSSIAGVVESIGETITSSVRSGKKR
jgi:hypothetical protein